MFVPPAMQARAAASLARLSLLPRLTRSFLPPAHHGVLLAVRLQLRQGAALGARLSSSSASSKGSGAAESAAGKDGSGGSGEAGADGGGAAGGDGLEEPLVARVSRFIWGSIKVTLGAAVMGALLYSGYSIVMVLLPVGTSSNRIMLKASSILEGDPEVTAYYGQIKTYGVDLGGRNEGRRMFVPEHKYTDDLNGMPCVEQPPRARPAPPLCFHTLPPPLTPPATSARPLAAHFARAGTTASSSLWRASATRRPRCGRRWPPARASFAT